MPSLETLSPPPSMSTMSFSTATTPSAPQTPSSLNLDSPTRSEDNPDASLNITRVIDLSTPHTSVSPSPSLAQDKRVSALAQELSEVIKNTVSDSNGDAIVKAGNQKRWTLQEMRSALRMMGSITEGARSVCMAIPSPSTDPASPTPDTGASSPLSRPSSGGQDLSFAASSHLETDAQAIDEHVERGSEKDGPNE